MIIEIEKNEETGTYYAHMLDGTSVELRATNYQDAVMEADHLYGDEKTSS